MSKSLPDRLREAVNENMSHDLINLLLTAADEIDYLKGNLEESRIRYEEFDEI